MMEVTRYMLILSKYLGSIVIWIFNFNLSFMNIIVCFITSNFEDLVIFGAFAGSIIEEIIGWFIYLISNSFIGRPQAIEMIVYDFL